MSRDKKSIVYTLKAKCRDCYKCLRHCPVHAISIKDGQAYVDPDKCIMCGNCVKNCPQGVKVFRKDTSFARSHVENGYTVASVAPSFAAEYPEWKTVRIPSALRKLGFKKVFEASEAAPLSAGLAKKAFEESEGTGIYSACPAATGYVEKHRPEALPYMLDTSSPMVLHGRMIKAALGENVKVVFIGPCIAKKGEAEKPDNMDAIDTVLTFDELDEWFEEDGLELESCPESGFDEIGGQPFSRFYPLPGSMATASGIDDKKGNFLSANGSDEVEVLFECDLSSSKLGGELLFCSGGCINGPCMDSDSNLFQRRLDLMKYSGSQKQAPSSEIPGIRLHSKNRNERVPSGPEVPEEAINRVYKNTGKEEEAQRLNCGACGYPSCRDMAVAVIQGNAEEEMCIPFMRRMAEARSDLMMDTMPNGVVIVDDSLNIRAMNDTFKKYFSCNNSLIGRAISDLLPGYDFEKLLFNRDAVIDRTFEWKEKIFHQILYALPQEHKFVGIYSDITNHRMGEQKLEELKKQTASQAKELLDNQIALAARLAAFLGESTAKSEEIVERLMKSGD